MADQDRLWSSIGSAGTVDVADVAKVDFVGPVVKLHGVDIVGPLATQEEGESKAQSAIVFPHVQAVIRYDVTAVDGLGQLLKPSNVWALHVYCRPGRGVVDVKLFQLHIPTVNTSAPVTPVLKAQFTSTSSSNTQFVNLLGLLIFGPGQNFDFVNNTYYVEATLSANVPVTGLIDPPELAAVQIIQQPEEGASKHK